MDKAVLSKFLVERIPKGWINRLFPQGWTIERNNRQETPQGGAQAVLP